MYPQGTRKASKVGCKAHRAQLSTHQNDHCIFGTEEYTKKAKCPACTRLNHALYLFAGRSFTPKLSHFAVS